MGVVLLPQVSRRWLRQAIPLAILALLLLYLYTRSLRDLSGCGSGAQPCLTEGPPPSQVRSGRAGAGSSK
ncbi:hypothetical protein QTO34_009521 [Cnephaeus nilssonii]|uniref:Uncharacterized protein n=1 Tax=Cnephaeus nilssonii TaxID=3371016 RepID=A0AA40HHZ8_CNENI|nr:hypothetical protein QTO34_009521 [Eptesicus nilssonii]